jgi:hypothetical protein
MYKKLFSINIMGKMWRPNVKELEQRSWVHRLLLTHCLKKINYLHNRHICF